MIEAIEAIVGVGACGVFLIYIGIKIGDEFRHRWWIRRCLKLGIGRWVVWTEKDGRPETSFDLEGESPMKDEDKPTTEGGG